MKQTLIMLRRVFKPIVSQLSGLTWKARRYTGNSIPNPSPQIPSHIDVDLKKTVIGQMPTVYYGIFNPYFNSLATGIMGLVVAGIGAVAYIIAETKFLKEEAHNLNEKTKNILDSMPIMIKAEITGALGMVLGFTESKVKEHIAIHAKEDERRYGELKSAISRLEGANDSKNFVIRKE